MDKHKTEVIFRKWKDDVIAIFPGLLTSQNLHYCESYQHIGQHGACDPYHLMLVTKPAKPEEYRALYFELTQFGYNLEVIKRLQTRHREERKRQLDEIMNHKPIRLISR